MIIIKSVCILKTLFIDSASAFIQSKEAVKTSIEEYYMSLTAISWFIKPTSKSRLPVSSWILFIISDTSISVGLWPHLLIALWYRGNYMVISRKLSLVFKATTFIYSLQSRKFNSKPVNFHMRSCHCWTSQMHWKLLCICLCYHLS